MIAGVSRIQMHGMLMNGSRNHLLNLERFRYYLIDVFIYKAREFYAIALFILFTLKMLFELALLRRQRDSFGGLLIAFRKFRNE